MTHSNLQWVAFGFALCACGTVETPTAMTVQPGINMQGINMQGMAMHGFLVDGVTLDGPLQNVRVERGEVVAERGATTLRGTALVGAHLFAEVRNVTANPSLTYDAEYRVTAISPEDSQYDSTHTGNTYLYTLEQWVPDTATWQPACGPDADGRNAAIPLAAIWDERGDRSVSSAMFTFGCTTGVIAKCYRWGYRPWVTGYGDLTAMHWACTRLARADYCGDGTPHTRNGTSINVWDRLPYPGPIQGHGGLLPPLGMLFEAGWNTGGAVCLSHARWLLDPGGVLAAACPDRLVAPTLPLIGGTVCNTAAAVLGYDPNALLFNEAYLNGL